MKHRTGYLFKRGDNYYVRWSVDGEIYTKSLRDVNGQPITTKPEAEVARDKLMSPQALASEAEALASLAGRASALQAEVDSKAKPLTLTQAWSAYLNSVKRPDTGPDTLAVYEGQFGQFRDWMKDTHPTVEALRDVTEDMAEEYAGHLNHGRLSPNTFNKHVRVLELVFRVLAKKGRIASNPWEGIQRKELTTASRRELTVEELRNVCRNATGDLRPLLALGIYTGLRLRDCATLRKGEVDLVRGIIRRVPNKTARRNPNPVLIPIHPSLRAEIEPLVTAQNETDYLLPKIATDYVIPAGKKRIIDSIQDHFVSQGVKIYKPGTGPDSKPAKEGEKPKRAVVEVGFHSLRHSFVSLCREANAPLAVVEAIVGHSNPAMTRHYSHVGELAASNAVALLPGIMTDAKPEPKKPEPEAILAQAQIIAQGMTGKTWKKDKTALLALLPQPTKAN